MSNTQNKFIYNNICLYKNNQPLDIDIDVICDELYAVADNKQKFKEIMDKLEKDVLSSDIDPPKRNINNYYSINLSEDIFRDIFNDYNKLMIKNKKIDFDDIRELERWIENCMRDGFAKAQEIEN